MKYETSVTAAARTKLRLRLMDLSSCGLDGGNMLFSHRPVKSARPRGNAGNALILASGPRGYSLNPPWPELLSGDEKALNRFLRKESDTAATVRFVFVWWGFNSDHSFSSFFFFLLQKVFEHENFLNWEYVSPYGSSARAPFVGLLSFHVGQAVQDGISTLPWHSAQI